MANGIFKEEFNIKRKKKSKIATRLSNNNLPKHLYQADTVGHEFNLGNYYYKREGGITYLLAYTNSGHAKLTYEGLEFNLNPGTFTFISLSNPSIIDSEGQDWEIFFIHLTGANIEEIYQAVTKTKKYCFENFNAVNFIKHINNIYKSYTTDLNRYYISQQIYSLIMDVMSQTDENTPVDLITKAKEYLITNYNKDFSIDKLCEDLFVSKYYFIRKFEQELHCTPKLYLMQIRVQKAKPLLVLTNKPLKDIALEVGFKTEKNIIYAFKKITGTTPSDFRKNIYE